MNEDHIKFLGKWVVAPIVACILLWKMASDAWAAAGLWLIIVPAALAALAFYFWQRSTKRSAHPWE
jgi:hypothetical protein